MPGRRCGWRLVALGLAVAVVAGCSTATGSEGSLTRAAPPGSAAPEPPATDPAPEIAPEPAVDPAVDPAAAPAVGAVGVEQALPELPEPAAPPPPEVPDHLVRTVHEQVWTPFAVVEGVVLLHPSARIELIGYHEAAHSGARELGPLDTSAPHTVLETRDRGTSPRSAADVVVDPEAEIRAPVTGRVVRAGTYVLYCDYSDDYAVIEPDDRPGWEVKILHIDQVQVRAGDRVEAGATVIAPRPTPLPFRSQVDDLTAEPSWPHVHIEVVDPSIPNQVRTGRAC